MTLPFSVSAINRDKTWKMKTGPVEKVKVPRGRRNGEKTVIKTNQFDVEISTNVTEKIPEQNASVSEREPKKRRYV